MNLCKSIEVSRGIGKFLCTEFGRDVRCEMSKRDEAASGPKNVSDNLCASVTVLWGCAELCRVSASPGASAMVEQLCSVASVFSELVSG